ncbi:MAG: hypothetical protein IPP90_08520 [Gemmatimonadaceae bacterium]|nr:hypothetical protein [Gemmatimonadaceae bacterium]
MTSTLPFIGTRTVAVPVDFFTALRKAVESPLSAVTVDSVRDAGYHAGQALFDAFTAWLAERGETTPDSLDDTRFASLTSDFFSEFGWGQLQFTSLSDAVIAVDADDWGEAEGHGGGCHVSTGLFAGFFGRLANAPIAVLEVQCRASGDERCRFLLGSIDVLGYVHEAMGRGIPYDRAAQSA